MRLWSAVDRETATKELRERAERLAPEVCEPGHQLVFGEGSPSARIVIVGEAPGDKEDKLGRPFVGPAGKLLEKELERLGIDRKDVWITNVVKCRPTKLIGGNKVNRTPTTAEVKAWLGILMGELEIISPEVIICAGALAANTLIHSNFAITKERGRWFVGPNGESAIATYHPAYLLRQVGEDWDRAMSDFRSDLAQAVEALRKAA